MESSNFRKLKRTPGVKSFSPSILNYVPLSLLTIIIFIAACYSYLYLPWANITIDSGVVPVFQLPLLSIIFFVFFAQLLHRLYDTKLLLCNEYVLFVSGLMSWREHTVRIHYNHIREIEINQTILQKLFNVGDLILISMSSQSEDEINIEGIFSPRKVKNFIEDHRFDDEHNPAMTRRID